MVLGLKKYNTNCETNHMVVQMNARASFEGERPMHRKIAKQPSCSHMGAA